VVKGGLSLLKELFAKSKKKYATVPLDREKQDVPEGIMTKCTGCKKIMYTKELVKNKKVCLHCGHHHPMSSHERIEFLFDAGTFKNLIKK
jgi:acetyl-CoA carboxylase carboxyl transferase subunit beta